MPRSATGCTPTLAAAVLPARPARLAVRHAFIDTEDGGLGLHRLKAYAAMENVASCRVLERPASPASGSNAAAPSCRDGNWVDTAAYDLADRPTCRDGTALQGG